MPLRVTLRKPESVRELDPSLALRSGTFDAWALLLLWCYRKSWLPLLWLGLIGATVAGIGDDVDARAAEVDTVGEWLHALVTPLAGVILSLFVRFTAGWFALALAYPLSRWNDPSQYGRGHGFVSRFRLWSDRLSLTRAYRSLRWSWAVRQVAAERLGRAGRRLMLCNPIMLWANVVLIITYVLVYTLT